MSITRCVGLFAVVLSLASGCSTPESPVDDVENGQSTGAVEADNTEKDGSHEERPHWSYTGDTGPDHWADLNAAWTVARDGEEQSPINIAGANAESLPPIDFNYQSSRVNIVNNGHTIQVNYDQGSFITVDAETYQLVPFSAG